MNRTIVKAKTNRDFVKLLGARIRSELNDLKRTPEACAKELGLEENRVKDILDGNCEPEESYALIKQMGSTYPIDVSDLMLLEDDCTHGVRIMRADASEASTRVFNRSDRAGKRLPYYEYRDTAMSRLSQFRPEWIEELRVVSDADPENPDVSYNNGHFMHQMTFFIGPVNFYYEVGGKKYCEEMDTGDSNYITPFFKHSFTSRDANKTALIIAVTFGGDVKRAQKELYALGQRGIEGFHLDSRQHKRAVTKLIEMHMQNEKLTWAHLKERLKGINLDVLFDENGKIPLEILEKLGEVLHVEPADLMLPGYRPEEEVVVRHKREEALYFYPSEDKRLYRINPLARTSKLPLMKGFDIEVLGTEIDLQNGFSSPLHSYVYAYGKAPITLAWEFDGVRHEGVLQPGDSLYIQPFVPHAFANPEKGKANVIIVGIPGAINLSTQRELSTFPDVERVALETKRWFN